MSHGLKELFEFRSDFLSPFFRSTTFSSFSDGLLNEVKCIVKSALVPSKSVTSVMLAEDPRILNFVCGLLSNHRFIQKALDILNRELGTDLNSAVVNHYSANKGQKEPHSDSESYIDRTQPLATLSIGNPRVLTIYEKGHDKRNQGPIISHTLENHSLYIMLPGSQQKTTHHISASGGERWSVSFRRVVKSQYNPAEWPYLPDANLPLMRSPMAMVTNSPANGQVAKSPRSLSELAQEVISNTPKSASNIHQTTPLTSSDLPKNPNSLFVTPPQSIKSKLESFLEQIDSLNIEDCKSLIARANNRISEIEKAKHLLNEEDVDKLVSYIEKPLSDIDHNDALKLVDDVKNDMDSLGLNDAAAKDGLTTQWLVEDPAKAGYINGVNINTHGGVMKLKEIISQLDPKFARLNACLASFYPSGGTCTRVHNDKLPYVSNSTPICNFSFGGPRDLAFFNARLHASPALKSYTLESESLLVMHEGCQDMLNHGLLPNSDANAGPRLCLSFREIIPLTTSAQQKDPPNDPDGTPTTVLIGTSITTRIDPAKVVGKHPNTNFINCSTSGAFIKDASEKIDQLYSGKLVDTNGAVVDSKANIKNIILSVGTNDIRRKSRGVSGLYYPLRDLLKKTRLLFPNAKVHVQSLIPMGYEYVWTPKNVVDYNAMSRRCCQVMGCSYIDIFRDFLINAGPNCYPNRRLFNDFLHPSPKGRGIIARAFIGITRN